MHAVAERFYYRSPGKLCPLGGAILESGKEIVEAKNYVDFTARYFEIISDERGGNFGAADDSSAGSRICASHGGSGKSCDQGFCAEVFCGARIQDAADTLSDHNPRRF